MVSVTQRIKDVKQPRGGFVSPKEFVKIPLEDHIELNMHENISAGLIGLTVDYLTRFLMGAPKNNAFRISLKGASLIGEINLAKTLLQDIKGLDDTSIIHAFKLSGFDVIFRAGLAAYRYSPAETITPDEDTIYNIKILVERSLAFFEKYGPITKDGFTFEGGYTDKINTGDGDFLTRDTLWDFKVSKADPTSKHTLQLLIYYLMGIHSKHNEFDEIEYLGIYNPRLNRVYRLEINKIPKEIILDVEHEVIGY